MTTKKLRIKTGQTWRLIEGDHVREFQVASVRKDKATAVTMVHGKDADGRAVSFPYEEVRDRQDRFAFVGAKIIRALRVELVKPTNMPRDVVEPVLRRLSSATPILLDAVYDALVSIDLVGKSAVKAVVAPTAKANSPSGIAYHAVSKKVAELRKWKPKGGSSLPYADLLVPSEMASAIGQAATHAYGRRDQGRVSFTSKRIIVRADKVRIGRDARGFTLALGLGLDAPVTFALAGSRGAHRDTLRGIADGRIDHGDCKLQYDEDRRKWYALLSYEAPRVEIPDLDPANVLVAHRGIRNALYLMTNTGKSKSWPGHKLVAQRRTLMARQRDIGRIANDERGRGAKGHGTARREENSIGRKIHNVTHTFCQQSAAFVLRMAVAWGCGTVVIENYGGIEPDSDATLRRVLERGWLHEMKCAIVSCLEPTSIALRETSSDYVSTTCPRCEYVDSANHNRRTGIFHCRACVFERPADWVAAFWMMDRSGADMTIWQERMRRELELVRRLKGTEQEAAE